MRRRIALALVLGSVVAPGCGRHLMPPAVPQAQLDARVLDDSHAAFAALVRAFERVLVVSDRLRVANVAACGERVGGDLGWVAWRDRDFDRAVRPLAREFLAVRGEPVVVALVPGGAAERAGVRVGDRVHEVGGSHVVSWGEIATVERTLAPTGATVVVERGGEELELAVEPARACAHGFEPTPQPVIYSVPIEGNIYVTLRLVEVASDDELAFALAHSLAMDLGRVNVSSLRSQDQFVPEPATTRTAVELSQRAGFSVDGVERLLELQATEQPNMVMQARPSKVELGELPRQIVALRMVRASLAAGR